MIVIKHFQEERGASGTGPSWAKAQEFLSKITREQLISVSVYPTGNHHNMVIVYCETGTA